MDLPIWVVFPLVTIVYVIVWHEFGRPAQGRSLEG